MIHNLTRCTYTDLLSTPTGTVPESNTNTPKQCRNGAKCPNKDKGCVFLHPTSDDTSNVSTNSRPVKSPSTPPPCHFGAKCWTRACPFTHPPQSKASSPINKNTDKDSDTLNDDISVLSADYSLTNCPRRIHCDDFFCELHHSDQRPIKCPQAEHCNNYTCEKLHPEDRVLCKDSCRKYNCTCVHPRSRPVPCRNKENCYREGCIFLHPDTHNPCPSGAECTDVKCTCVHPTGRTNVCNRAENCKQYGCELLHPDTRPSLCGSEASCDDYHCKLIHPPARPRHCVNGDTCPNIKNCRYLHPTAAPIKPSSASLKGPVENKATPSDAHAAKGRGPAPLPPPQKAPYQKKSNPHTQKEITDVKKAPTVAIAVDPTTLTTTADGVSPDTVSVGSNGSDSGTVKSILSTAAADAPRAGAMRPRKAKPATVRAEEDTTTTPTTTPTTAAEKAVASGKSPKSKQIPKDCDYSDRCCLYTCNLIHPTSRRQPCTEGNSCISFYCALLHPKERPNQCKFGLGCKKGAKCSLLHPM